MTFHTHIFKVNFWAKSLLLLKKKKALRNDDHLWYNADELPTYSLLCDSAVRLINDPALLINLLILILFSATARPETRA